MKKHSSTHSYYPSLAYLIVVFGAGSFLICLLEEIRSLMQADRSPLDKLSQTVYPEQPGIIIDNNGREEIHLDICEADRNLFISDRFSHTGHGNLVRDIPGVHFCMQILLGVGHYETFWMSPEAQLVVLYESRNISPEKGHLSWGNEEIHPICATNFINSHIYRPAKVNTNGLLQPNSSNPVEHMFFKRFCESDELKSGAHNKPARLK